MTLQIQMLGTGNAFSKKYYNNNALVYSNNTTLLIDCGITAPLALHHLNKSVDEIDGILITHQHSDHIGGLEELAFRLHFIHKKKIALYIPETLVDSLWENSLKGGLHNGEKDANLHTYFNVVPMQEGQATQVSTDLTIEIIRTEHIANKFSYSLIINDCLFYSADIRFNKALIEQLYYERQINYILHECQLVGVGHVHTTLDELLTLPDDIQKIIQLMHYDDIMEEFVGKTGGMTFLKQHELYHYR